MYVKITSFSLFRKFHYWFKLAANFEPITKFVGNNESWWGLYPRQYRFRKDWLLQYDSFLLIIVLHICCKPRQWVNSIVSLVCLEYLAPIFMLFCLVYDQFQVLPLLRSLKTWRKKLFKGINILPQARRQGQGTLF